LNESILQKIKELLQKTPDMKPKMPIEKISLDSRFRQDLGFDSLAMASLFYELQDLYPHLEESQVKNWQAMSDCIESILSTP
jgi:acyl carrier protein